MCLCVDAECFPTLLRGGEEQKVRGHNVAIHNGDMTERTPCRAVRGPTAEERLLMESQKCFAPLSSAGTMADGEPNQCDTTGVIRVSFAHLFFKTNQNNPPTPQKKNLF